MICEEKDVGNDMPSHIPVDVFVVNKDAHQLGDGKRWVGLDYRIKRLREIILASMPHVVQLNGNI
jgi:hypothetical protein